MYCEFKLSGNRKTTFIFIATQSIGMTLHCINSIIGSKCMIKQLNLEMSSQTNEQTAISELRLLISSSKVSLPSQDNHNLLLKCLRKRNMNSSKAYSSLSKLSELHRSHHEAFKLPSHYKEMFTNGFVNVMPNRGPNGELITIQRSSSWDCSVHSAELVCSSFMPIIDYFSEIGGKQIQSTGVILIADYEGFSFAHLLSVKAAPVRLITSIYTYGLTLKLVKVHCVNVNRFVTLAWSILKYTFPAKLRDRFVFHDRVEELHEIYGKDVLPRFLGGNQPDKVDWTDEDLEQMDMIVADVYKSLASKHNDLPSR